MEKNAPITVDEFHTFNRCLDDAIADAVTSFAGGAGEPSRAGRASERGNRPGGGDAPSARNGDPLVAAIKAGQVSVRGATAGVHEKSLIALQALIDRVLNDANPDAALGKISADGAAPS